MNVTRNRFSKFPSDQVIPTITEILENISFLKRGEQNKSNLTIDLKVLKNSN